VNIIVLVEPHALPRIGQYADHPTDSARRSCGRHI